jgi:class 3 adenylate cyclase/tetratricopeptide (TPR) repeat protein
VQTCPSCGTDVPADARFCATCGAPLAGATGALTGAGEERRLVTVLFADVTGSTELGEQLDAERVRATLQRYFGAMSAVISAWNGTVEKYIGDAIMAVFGIPTAHEDDAQRACSAALEMLERLATVNEELNERFGVTVQIRIGLNSGEVVTRLGADGLAPAAGQFLVSGDVVNVASRLQSAAEPGEVLVGPRTYLAARHAFAFGEEQPLELKGKSAPVNARRLLGELPETQRGVPGLESPMIGRDRELDLLSGLLDEAIEVDRPRLVTIYGTAGIGKSRLLRELIARVDGHDPPVTVLRGRCLAAGQRVTFWALGEWLRGVTATSLADASPIARERIGARVREILAPLGLPDDEVAETVDALALTAGIGPSDARPDGRTPAEVAEAMARAWPRFAAGLARTGPALLVVEDLHWADDEMLDLLSHIATRAQGAILLVLTARPEFAESHPGFAANAEATAISLRPLTDAQGRELVEGLLHVDRLPAELRTDIVARAEGNPFFVEELLRRLIDEGAIVREQDRWVATAAATRVLLPDSIQALLAARLDGLPTEEKRVVQEAAVVGRFFWPGALGVASPRAQLEALERRGLVMARPTSSMAGEPEYAVRHALIRDVAYASVPKARRARSHAEVGAWLERMAGSSDELAEVIASHYQAAVAGEEADLAWVDDPGGREVARARAVATLLRAGDRLRQRNALPRALELHRQALALARDDERAAILEAIGEDERFAFHGDEAVEAYLRAAEALPDGPELREDLSRIAGRAATIAQRFGAFQQPIPADAVQDLVRRALSMATDPATRSRLLAAYGGLGRAWLGSRMGRPLSITDNDPLPISERLSAANEALDLANELDDAELIYLATDALSVLLWDLRDLEGYRRVVARQREILPRLPGDRYQVDILFASGLATLEAGRPAEARAIALPALAMARDLSPHDMMHASYTVMKSSFDLGAWDEVLELFGPHREASLGEGDVLCTAVRCGPLLGATVLAERGRRDEARRLVPPDAHGSDRMALSAGWALIGYARALGDEAMRERWTRAIVATGAEVDLDAALELTTSLAESGEWRTLRRVIDDLREVAELLPSAHAAIARAEGRMAAAHGDVAGGIALLRSAIAEFDAIPSVLEGAISREWLAALDPDAAPSLLREALAAYERLGAEPRAASVRARLGITG